MCAGNELFFCMLYLLHFTSGPICKYHYNNCLFPVHLCKQYCLKHSTLVFHGLVVLSPENNHTHPTEGPMTILRGEGVLQGGWGGGCSELFQKLLHAGVWIFSRTTRYGKIM